jgi:hypothetical protein
MDPDPDWIGIQWVWKIRILGNAKENEEKKIPFGTLF